MGAMKKSDVEEMMKATSMEELNEILNKYPSKNYYELRMAGKLSKRDRGYGHSDNIYLRTISMITSILCDHNTSREVIIPLTKIALKYMESDVKKSINTDKSKGYYKEEDLECISDIRAKLYGWYNFPI